MLRSIPSGEGNPSLICGFLAGLSDRSVVTRVLEQVSSDDRLTLYLVELTRLCRPEAGDLIRVVEMVKRGKIPLMQIYAFSYNSVIDHLPPEVAHRFLATKSHSMEYLGSPVLQKSFTCSLSKTRNGGRSSSNQRFVAI